MIAITTRRTSLSPHSVSSAYVDRDRATTNRRGIEWTIHTAVFYDVIQHLLTRGSPTIARQR